MKCPKCGYLGFEHVDRCRNCGYDFSLTASAAVPDLSIRPGAAPESPLDDLSLLDSAMAGTVSGSPTVTPDLDGVMAAPVSARSAKPASFVPGELPLFGTSVPGDEPLITKASPPRAPLAVRRATPEIARVRIEPPRAASLDLSLDGESSRGTMDSWSDGETGETTEDAAVGARVVAVVIDLLILAAIDAVVIYFTIQICGITLNEIDMLPKTPLVAFLFVQNVGYLVAFTAGGQTLGKMAAGIRVVPADADSSLDLSRAFLRTLLWLVLAVPAGLGFLTALLSRDHRGLHDRFAGTRVVR